MSKLHHYTTAQGLVGMIESKKIHCTNYMFMNDPTEMEYFKNILNKALEECPECGEIYNLLTTVNFTEFFNNTHVYFLSLTENGDSLTMWRYYSKSNGCSLEVDLDIDKYNELQKEKNDTPLFKIEKVDVIYDEGEQIKKIKKTILDFKSVCIDNKTTLLKLQEDDYSVMYDFFAFSMSDKCPEELRKRQFALPPKESTNTLHLCDFKNIAKSTLQISLFNERMTSIATQFKDEAYKDEKESRLIISLLNEPDNNSIIQKRENVDKRIKYKTSESGVVVEYFELDFDPVSAIKSIILHPSSSKIQQKGVERMLKHRGINTDEVGISEKPFRVM